MVCAFYGLFVVVVVFIYLFIFFWGGAVLVVVALAVETNFKFYNKDIDAVGSMALFSGLCCRCSGLIVGCSICLRTLLQRGKSEPMFCGNSLVVGRPSFGHWFGRII